MKELDEFKIKSKEDRRRKIPVKLRRKRFAVFIDLEKAFDRVDRKILLDKLRQLNIDPHLSEAIRVGLGNTSAILHDETVKLRIGVP